jgi:hypothetical protein
MARAPTTASGASTQKSIASMHSPLSLAVGYNRIVTRGRRSCNNVVAILANALYCPWPRLVDPILLGAAFSLRPLRVARDLGWCEYDHPRWAGTLYV